jgi:DNA-directed RNA polymerase specialized sigma24 family protein
MIQDDFDLDQTSPGDESLRSGVARLSAANLATAISSLPADLRPIAVGVHVEGRTLSDVSQELGLRQAEVVRGLRRARRAILASRATAAP